MTDGIKPLRTALLVLGLALSSGAWGAALAQDAQGQDADDEDTRQIKYSDFTKKRPAPSSANGSGAASGPAQPSAPTYHRIRPATGRKPIAAKPRETAHATKAGKPDTAAVKSARANRVEWKEVGVTLWRLRPARETDTGPGFEMLQGGKLVVMTPERIEGTAPVSMGDRVRISVESPTDGYLYVINREQYADGTTGPPSLIFPTTRIRGGENKVYAGRLVDIPDSGDRQPFFTLTSSQKDGQPKNVGELVTILITPKPLEGITPDRGPIPLKPEQVAKWESEWEGEVVEMLEMEEGAGKAWTMEEKLAGEATRALTQLDPMPQTIYRVSGKPNEPLMITVQLIYGAQAASRADAGGRP